MYPSFFLILFLFYLSKIHGQLGTDLSLSLSECKKSLLREMTNKFQVRKRGEGGEGEGMCY